MNQEDLKIDAIIQLLQMVANTELDRPVDLSQTLLEIESDCPVFNRERRRFIMASATGIFTQGGRIDRNGNGYAEMLFGSHRVKLIVNCNDHADAGWRIRRLRFVARAVHGVPTHLGSRTSATDIRSLRDDKGYLYVGIEDHVEGEHREELYRKLNLAWELLNEDIVEIEE